MRPETLSEWVEANPNQDAQTLASKIIDKLPTEELVRLVAEEIDHIRRMKARVAEAEAFRSFRPSIKPGRVERKQHINAGAFRAVIGSTFKVGNGVEVSWGQATIEQHEQRVAMLERMRNGLDDTIRNHKATIAAMRDAGVNCLDDLLALRAKAA